MKLACALFGSFSLAVLSGCGSGVTPGYIGYTALRDGKGERTVLFGFDANRRGQIARLTDSGELIDSCSEPPPDAATTLAQKASAEGSGAVTTAAAATGEGKLSGAYESSQAVIELGKRTAETLFLREILFRRCEARMNARSVAQADTRTAKEKAAEALTKGTADDKFFADVIAAYSGLAVTKERAERAGLMRELQQKLPAEALRDPDLLNKIALAVDDPAKIADVYKRAAELAKETEEKRKKDAEAAAKKKCEESEKAAIAACKTGCSGEGTAKSDCQSKCDTDKINQCVKEAMSK
ncbi:MAG: hypothetical protein HUU21_02805 [Polyangiaceae bacterium]|nr:hypothetical protein [Polyangiaceae bacterium]NUQ72463.1 hypothetical protein [Polyangiaceae bacterium]